MMRGIPRMLLFALIVGAAVDGAEVDVRASSDDITAASCNKSDVQAALDRASAGDTIYIPAGTCTWTSGLVWTAPANVTLQGAGNPSTLGGGDATIIVDNYESTSPLLNIVTNATGTFRIAGLTLRGGSVDINNSKYNGLITLSGSSKQMRVDHITCNLRTYSNPATTGRCFYITGWIYGVVDHSIFELPNNTGQALQFAHNAYGGATDGDGAWAADTALGTEKFIVVEDNTFTSLKNTGTAQDCLAGGRFVWRYNKMTSAGLQTHPTGGAGRGRGCRAWEVYGNTYSGSNDTPIFNAYFISSGTGVMWGNTALTGTAHFITLHSMRRTDQTYRQSATPMGWGYCGTSLNGTSSNWDENTTTINGYRCFDQPGSGKGDLLSGTFPNVTNTATGCQAGSPCASPRQIVEPIYEWSNNWAAAPGFNGQFVAVNPIYSGALANNRDYYLNYGNAACGVNAVACIAGVGSGTLSQRPSSCTTGVAWWATDQGGNWHTTNASANDGALYKCTSINTWTLSYKPLTYPHPLILKRPAAPTNLKLVG